MVEDGRSLQRKPELNKHQEESDVESVAFRRLSSASTDAERSSAYWNIMAQPRTVALWLSVYADSFDFTGDLGKVISESFQLRSQAALENDPEKKAQMLSKSNDLMWSRKKQNKKSENRL